MFVQSFEHAQSFETGSPDISMERLRYGICTGIRLTNTFYRAYGMDD